MVETEVKQIDLHPEQLKDDEWQVRDVSDYIIAHSACNIRVKRCENRMYPVRLVFLNRRAAARYRALASIIPGRERFSWNLSF